MPWYIIVWSFGSYEDVQQGSDMVEADNALDAALQLANGGYKIHAIYGPIDKQPTVQYKR